MLSSVDLGTGSIYTLPNARRSALATRMMPLKLIRFMAISFSLLSLDCFGAASGVRISDEPDFPTKFFDIERKLVWLFQFLPFPFLLGLVLIMLAQKIARRIQRRGFAISGLQQSCELLRTVDQPFGFTRDRFLDEDAQDEGFSLRTPQIGHRLVSYANRARLWLIGILFGLHEASCEIVPLALQVEQRGVIVESHPGFFEVHHRAMSLQLFGRQVNIGAVNLASSKKIQRKSASQFPIVKTLIFAGRGGTKTLRI